MLVLSSDIPSKLYTLDLSGICTSGLSTALTSGLALEKLIMGVGVTTVELVTFLGIIALAPLVLGQGGIVTFSSSM